METKNLTTSTRYSKYKPVLHSLRWDQNYCPKQVADFALESGFLKLIHPNLVSQKSRELLRISIALYSRKIPFTPQIDNRPRAYKVWPGYQWAGFATKDLAAKAIFNRLDQLICLLPMGVNHSIDDLANQWSYHVENPSKAFKKRYQKWRATIVKIFRCQLTHSLSALFEYLGEEEPFSREKLSELADQVDLLLAKIRKDDLEWTK